MKVLKFYADWCQPCKIVTNTLKDIQTDIPVEDVNIESADPQVTELLRKFNIRGVPTMIMVDESGNEVKRKVGVAIQSELQAFLSKE